MSDLENAVVPLNPDIQTKLTPLLDFSESFTGMVMAPNDNRYMYLLQQSGVIFKYDQITEQLDPTPLLDLREEIEALYKAKPNQSKFADERGLLGLAFPPGFTDADNYLHKTFIVMHSEIDNPDMYQPMYRDQFQQDVPNPDHMNCISMYHLENSPDKTKATRKDILCFPHPQMNHNGGGLVFDVKDYLWIGIGDGGGANDEHGPLLDPKDPTSFLGNAQNIHSLHGKLLRIAVDPTMEDGELYYSIPMGYPRSDNPFAPDYLGNPARPREISSTMARKFPTFVKDHPEITQGLPEVANWGFRNPWRMFFDGTDLYVADVGQDKFESIKLVQGFGGNYLWRGYEGFSIFNETVADYMSYQTSESKNLPIIAYGREMGIATVGAGIYRGSRIPALTGKLIIADYSGRVMISTPPKDETKKIPSPGKTGQDWPLSTLFKLETRIHSLAFDNEGEVYFLTFNSKTKEGQFLRLDRLNNLDRSDRLNNLDRSDRLNNLDRSDRPNNPNNPHNPSSTKEELTEDDVGIIIEQAVAASRRTKSLLRRENGQPTSTKMHIAIMSPQQESAELVYSNYDAWAGSVDIAKRKAYTAFAFSSNENALTTRTIQALSQLKKASLQSSSGGKGTLTFEDVPLFQIGNSNPVGGIIEFPGGVPLYKNGVLVGAIGVSGDGVDQDEVVAIAGAVGYQPPRDIRADIALRLPYYGLNRVDEL